MSETTVATATRESFAAAIRTDPAARAAYADWLEEQGDPAGARVQRLLARTGASPDRYTFRRALAESLGVTPEVLDEAQRREDPPPNPAVYCVAAAETMASEALGWADRNARWIARVARKLAAKARCRPDRGAASARAARKADRRVAEAARTGRTLPERIADAASEGSLVTEEPDHGRRRVRTVGCTKAAADARGRALESGKWRAVCRHGGDVANKYGYPASTECVLAVSDSTGRVCVWFSQAPANKVTTGGAAGTCLPCARPLFDGRFGGLAERQAWDEIKRLHRLLCAGGYQWEG